MILTRTTRTLAWIPLLALLAVAARAEETAPEPRFSGIDYAKPARHLALSPKVGDAKRIQSIATQLRGDSSAKTLANIHQWMHRNLRYDANAAYRWRSLDEMLKDRTYGGCADHAAVFGTFARAAGIPTVWVKTMDVDWIEDFRAGRPQASKYRGHVFLEVHVDGAWRLLDAQVMRLYGGDYDPARTRILPGNRFAYDKGGDPFALVLSCRWELWKKQTDAYFAKLDPSLVPWAVHEDLLAPWRVWIAGNNPQYRYAADACRRLGYHVVLTFNGEFDRILPQTKGKTLIVTCQGRRPVLPEKLWPTMLPPGYEGVVNGSTLPKDGFLLHRLRDGTRVILVTGQDMTALHVGVAKALNEAVR